MDISENSEPLPGYRLKRFLGRGSYGEAWEAVAPGDMPVAIKFIRLHQSLTDSDQRELDILRKVRHAHLLDVHLVQEKDGYLLMGMPLCDQDLLGRLKECQDQGLPGIPGEELLDLMEESAKALDFLHRHNVLHRDIKPANIFLVGGTAKVADFGLARVLNHSLSTQSGLKGTPAYVAPEIVQGQGAKASDQYSLAISYCQLRTGRFPIKADGRWALILAHVQKPPDLRGYAPQEAKVLERALTKSPDARWPTCRDFIKELRNVVDAVSASPSPPPKKRTPALDTPATITNPPDFGKPPSARPAKRKHKPGEERNNNCLQMPLMGSPKDEADRSSNEHTPETRLTKLPKEHEARKWRGGESVGIKLGNTYSAIAFMDSNIVPRMAINSKGQSIIPSVVYFGEDEVLVGEPALQYAEIEAEHVAHFATIHRNESWRQTFRGQSG